MTDHSGIVTEDSGRSRKSVTFNQNRRSRSVGTTGHVQTESAVKMVRNTQLATLAPVAMIVILGSSLFWWACAIFVLGMLIIGTVLGRETHLLYCPHCGRRPTPLFGQYQSPFNATYCAHCGFWLREPETPHG